MVILIKYGNFCLSNYLILATPQHITEGKNIVLLHPSVSKNVIHTWKMSFVLWQAVLWDFQYGMQYAWMLCIFAIIISYSIPCPLVTPFGKCSLSYR